jgi:hypothetical protein
MFDDLRQSGSFLEEEPSPETQPEAPKKEPRKSRDGGNFLGMTAAQRFVLALTLLFMACALGGFCLILTNKVYLPFF